ncbi:MAG: DUF547 domain-containing protein, partial [Deltaproteobacteria bacterium]|nr:DUF547 domain-containing protein [Deltaproteobacteria bacterium]
LGRVLAKHVNAEGKVDYKGIAAERADLDLYVAYLAATSPDKHPDLFPTRDDQLAYYINAYNAFAISGVINRPGLTGVNDNIVDFFYLTKYRMGGKKISLYDLENKVVRKRYNDARVHFALNCQSGGCPRLPAEIFDPKALDAQLEAMTREFVNNPAKVEQRDDGKVHVSQIFEWYADDFKSAGGPVAFINAHGGNVPADKEVAIIPYDWTLIAQDGRAP